MSSRNPKYIQKYKWTIVSLYYLGKHIKKYARNMEFLPIKLSYTQVVSESVYSFCSQLNVIHIVFNFFKLCDFLHRWNIFVFIIRGQSHICLLLHQTVLPFFWENRLHHSYIDSQCSLE